MSFFRIFDIASSGMNAQSVRLNTVASNIANAQSVSEDPEKTYRARYPIFKASEYKFNDFLTDATEKGTLRGVEVSGIVESEATFPKRYQPEHPMADDEGYVLYPNVNLMDEMADMIAASRAYQSNAELFNTSKRLMQRTLEMGRD